MTDRVAIASVTRVSGSGSSRRDQDLVAVEAPLELTLRSHDGVETRSAGILMRTPGDDRELVVGLLVSEGLVRRQDDVVDVAVRDSKDGLTTVEVTLSARVPFSSIATERLFAGTSACGLCGRLAVAALDRRPAVSPGHSLKVPAEVIATLPASLRDAQTVFAETGGLHAAGFFSAEGTRLAVREDVGRHNAVDKLIGAAWIDQALPAADRILVVSGRVAFEIVQKTAMAGVPLLVAVGAPSSLAIEAARASQVTLVGFVRDGRFNVYSAPERILPPADHDGRLRSPV